MVLYKKRIHSANDEYVSTSQLVSRFLRTLKGNFDFIFLTCPRGLANCEQTRSDGKAANWGCNSRRSSVYGLPNSVIGTVFALGVADVRAHGTSRGVV